MRFQLKKTGFTSSTLLKLRLKATKCLCAYGSKGQFFVAKNLYCGKKQHSPHEKIVNYLTHLTSLNSSGMRCKEKRTYLYMIESYIRSMTHTRCLIWWHFDADCTEMSAYGEQECSSLAWGGLSVGTTGGFGLVTKPSHPWVTCRLFVRTQRKLHSTLPWSHQSCAAGSDWQSFTYLTVGGRGKAAGKN